MVAKDISVLGRLPQSPRAWEFPGDQVWASDEAAADHRLSKSVVCTSLICSHLI